MAGWNIGSAQSLAVSCLNIANETLLLRLAIVVLFAALIAGALGLGAVTGAAFAVKVLSGLALLAFLISAAVEVARREAP
jgi:uncharacterized membrane protein YtjA (UPF0391 family)